MNWNVFWAMTCHYIWLWLNREDHNENATHPTSSWVQAFKLTRECVEVSKTIGTHAFSSRISSFVAMDSSSHGLDEIQHGQCL